MSDPIIHPGPAAIEPDQCPGGVVFHVYGVPSRLLLITSKIDRLDGAAIHAEIDADLVMDLLGATGDHAACLVAYDGDTGHRFSADDWMATT